MAYDLTPLAESDLTKFLQTHPHWRHEGGALRRAYEFGSFKEAVAFVNRVADIAEANDHHPDIDIRYRKVMLALTTHDVGGLTYRDPLVASEVEKAR